MATARVLLLVSGGGGVLVYGGISTRRGDRLNRTFGRPRVQPDFQPFFGRKKGGDGLNRTFGRPIERPKVRRADKSAEPQVRFNPGSCNHQQLRGEVFRIEKTIVACKPLRPPHPCLFSKRVNANLKRYGL